MDRDTAIRLDGMLRSAKTALMGVAEYIRENASDAERKEMIHAMGRSIAEAIEVSNRLYELYPDIIPNELKSPYMD